MKPSTRILISSILLAITAVSPSFGSPGSDEAENEPLFSQAALDQMLAPIALYPDVLLSQVLIASTYPLEVVEASRWTRANRDLKGDDAVAAVEDQDWDPSIKTLVGFPELIELMDENLTWTRRLGDAFLMQEEAVMETVQSLRQVALEEGSLEDLEHVVVEQEADVIIIEPAETRVVYVPYYNTRYVYGSWWWYDYPPYCWGPAPVYSSVGFHWSSGFHFSTSFFYSNCYWPSRRVVVVEPHKRHPHYSSYREIRRSHHDYRDAPSWRHDPIHRRGVRYPSEAVNDRHSRHSASGITRSEVPDRGSRMEHRVASNRQREAIPADSQVRLSRGESEISRQGPSVRNDGTRSSGISRTSSNSSREAVASRAERANRLARSTEGRRLVRTTEMTRTTRASEPKPVVRQSSRQISSTNRENRQGPTVASNRQDSSSQRQAQPSRQTQPSRQQAQPSRQVQPTPQQSSSSSNDSYKSSNNSTWRNNNSYASNRPSRPERPSAPRQAVRTHIK